MTKPARTAAVALLGWAILLEGYGPADDGRDGAALTQDKASGAARVDTRLQWPDSPVHKRLVAKADKSVADGAKRVAKDRFRPAFHFLCASRFMNDPNGCVHFNGVYHIFFQHQPFWGEPDASTAPAWGHAISHDLVHWTHLPIALMPVPGTYDSAAVASGGCVIADGLPIIIYTSVPPQAQSLARSFDGMRTWQRFAGNPVIPKPPPIAGLEEGFRDPFVWREGEKWRMIVGSGIRGQGGTVLLYESADLLSWDYLGPLCTAMGADCYQWECANFFQLDDHWVLVVSPLLHSMPSVRGPVQYAVGEYDGRRFKPGEWHEMDLGGPTIYYAPNSLEDDRGRRIQWGWLMGGGEPGSPWNGMLTLPRRLQLGSDMRLRVYPVQEVDTLRDKLLADFGGRELKASEHLDVCTGIQLDVVLDLTRSDTGRLLVNVFQADAGDSATTIHFDTATGRLRCGDKQGIVPRDDGDIDTLRILVDRSVIEVYANRRTVMSLRAYPQAGADGLRLVAEDGSIQLNRVRVWQMGSIW